MAHGFVVLAPVAYCVRVGLVFSFFERRLDCCVDVSGSQIKGDEYSTATYLV